MQLRSFFLGCRTPDEMPVVQAPFMNPATSSRPSSSPTRRTKRPNRSTRKLRTRNSPHDEGVPAQLVTPAAPAVWSHPLSPRHIPANAARSGSRHCGTEARPLLGEWDVPSERVSGNADNPADIPAGESIERGPVSALPSQPPYCSAAPVMPAVSPT